MPSTRFSTGAVTGDAGSASLKWNGGSGGVFNSNNSYGFGGGGGNGTTAGEQGGSAEGMTIFGGGGGNGAGNGTTYGSGGGGGYSTGSTNSGMPGITPGVNPTIATNLGAKGTAGAVIIRY